MKIINTWLIKGLYILSIAIILYGCSKGKLDEDFVPLTKIIFDSETMIYPKKIEVSGKIYDAFGTGTIVPYNDADSSTDAVAIFSDGKRLNFKFENKLTISCIQIFLTRLILFLLLRKRTPRILMCHRRGCNI